MENTPHAGLKRKETMNTYNVLEHLKSVEDQWKGSSNTEAAIEGERQILKEIVAFIVAHDIELTKTQVINMLKDFQSKKRFT
jgi:hypothetical protein